MVKYNRLTDDLYLTVEGVNVSEEYRKAIELMKKHHEWMHQTINLIASENISSPAVRMAMTCDFGHRYAEGWPGERVYAGCIYIDEMELLAVEMMKEIFKAEFADVRPISGVVANLAIYTAFTKPGDRMMALSIPCGGHISMGRGKIGGTAGAVHGLRVTYFPYNEKELNIDPDATVKKIRKSFEKGKKIKLLMFGGSVLPFPQPIKEIAEVAKEYDIIVNYDAAHVAGLIAGGIFQDPLREGADTMTMSTHKTLPGPQHGAIVAYEKYAEPIKKAVFPGLVSNHHLHSIAALVIALAEMKAFGQEYAKAIVRNAKALAQALYERGLNVLGEEKGFTESHVILVDITKYGDGGTLEKKLEKANIIVNRNLLPWDIREGRNYMHPGGIRLGTSEVTRLGMGPSEMEEIAEFIARVIVKGEDVSKVAKDVAEFRKEYTKLHYCFETVEDAYKYLGP